MDNELTRPALGANAPLGSLYDARLDSFVNATILKGMPAAGVSYHLLESLEILHIRGDSYWRDFKAMNIGHDFAASLISGLAPSDLMTRHLTESDENARRLQSYIHHTMATKREDLDVMNDGVRQCISASHLRTSTATHVVTEIVYGAHSILKMTRWLDPDIKKEGQEYQFHQQIDTLINAMRQNTNDKMVPALPVLDQIILRSTALGSDEIVLCSTNEMFKFFDAFDIVGPHVKRENVQPIAYKLLPVQYLKFARLLEVQVDLPLISASQECLERFIQLCDEFRHAESALSEYRMLVSRYRYCVPDDHLHDISSRLKRLKAEERNFRSSFARTLEAVRRGSSNSEALRRILQDFSEGGRSPRNISFFPDDFRWKTSLVGSLVTRGAIYLGLDSPDLEKHLAKRSGTESYVFFFSREARGDQESWNANQALMLSLLQSRKPDSFFFIYDCDAVDLPLKKCIVSQYENGQRVTTDLLEEQEYMAGLCFARFLPGSLDKQQVQRPTKRCLVKIPCPGGGCSKGEICEWHCINCHTPLEYGYTDQYIYCDCGRSLYSNYDFKCNSSTHGPGYERYNNTTSLLNHLKSLDQSDYLNILILGETGVGKSTFINAFVNYLYFQSLDDALEAEGLQSVIPCHFNIQSKYQIGDETEIKETKISVGDRADEKDGTTGDSATQQTQVYPINVGASTYRLIDTPGIGDTRGLKFDKENMIDILRTVSGYDHLHGILILLRSNNARLTAHFSFCVKELLSHLHRDAAHNVVWGFTNTRISNYMPGDTYGSLKKLLNERSDIGLSLSHSSAYCFDSESFRYLAAYKQGTVMENKPDFVNSWDKSWTEAQRMLNYFRGKDPHPVKSTLSLNGTRTLIMQLTKPMAEISKQISVNIALVDDEVHQLSDVRLTGDKLKQKLRPEVTLLRPKDMTEPRTVCKNQGCMEVKDDGTGNNMVTHYPNPCHAPCYLDHIPPDVLAPPDLSRCSAFSGSETCQQCNHHWTLHMHIYYELETYKARITDTTIEQKIKEHANDITLREAAINDRAQLTIEWRAEREKVRDAAAKFGLWMKANSILPINDATLAYLDILIKAEQAKVDAGGTKGGKANKQVLADLEEDKSKHEELVAVLEDSMKGTGQKAPIAQDEVEQIVNSLYSLKHFGKSLEELKIGITDAHEMTNREMPLRVNNRHKSRSGHSRTPSAQRSTDNDHHHSHGQSQQWDNRHLHPSSASGGPTKLQRPQSINLGFSSGTMRFNAAGIASMPGSFVTEVPTRGGPPPVSRSTKPKGFIASMNPWSR